MAAGAVVLGSLLAFGIPLAGALTAPEAALAAGPANIILIQTDDQTLSQMRFLPRTRRLIGRNGVTFERYYVSYPICCPSRVSLMSGDYVHNHGILVNKFPYSYFGFRESEQYHHNIAVWLQRAGYRTIHVGKFINHYGETGLDEIPPGWSDWTTVTGNADARLYYSYRVNENGTIRLEERYSTRFVTDTAIQKIKQAAAEGFPFFMQLDYNAPHAEASGLIIGPRPEPRFAHRFADLRLPEPPSFNERRIRDKPFFVSHLRPLNRDQRGWMAAYWRNAARSLQSVDVGVNRIFKALRRTGQLGRTYVVFTSDNGFFFGEHRLIAGKYLPYEEASHVPLLIRGPGIPKNERTRTLASNVDLPATLHQLVGAEADAPLDGASLVPDLRSPRRARKRAILLEGYTGDDENVHFFPRSNNASVTDYFGVVSGRWKFVQYAMGARELYDLEADPYETENLVHREPQVAGRMGRLTSALSRCRASTCRALSFGRPARAPR